MMMPWWFYVAVTVGAMVFLRGAIWLIEPDAKEGEMPEKSFPEAAIVWKSNSPTDAETAKRLSEAAETFHSVPVPGKSGLWKITEIDVVDGTMIVRGVPDDSTDWRQIPV